MNRALQDHNDMLATSTRLAQKALLVQQSAGKLQQRAPEAFLQPAGGNRLHVRLRPDPSGLVAACAPRYPQTHRPCHQPQGPLLSMAAPRSLPPTNLQWKHCTGSCIFCVTSQSVISGGLAAEPVDQLAAMPPCPGAPQPPSPPARRSQRWPQSKQTASRAPQPHAGRPC